VATAIVAGVSSILILTNFLAKLCGYSEIGWNFELLFMIIDGAALTALIYGLYTDNAAFLQPFVALSVSSTIKFFFNKSNLSDNHFFIAGTSSCLFGNCSNQL